MKGKYIVLIASLITIGILISIIGYVAVNGVNFILNDEEGILGFLFKAPKNAGRSGGISTIMANTLFMVFLTLFFSVPIGIGAAIYLTEYAGVGRIVSIIKFSIDILAGIPSIIFGLFGFIFFTTYLRLGIGLLSGSLTLTIMILPTIIRTSMEAISAVPVSYREGSIALGATKWDTIKRVVVPSASSGILAGIILAVGRIIGETAALLFTTGTDYRLADSLSSSSRVLSIHLYLLAKEGISFDRAFATANVLIIFILVINFVTNMLIRNGGIRHE
ncbi:phosphate ABC transporter permease PstA [Xylanivirga thermophila]|uniref:phosphate ABC transporter permease PstA n=1 Tax=Xylanivirga thermophila TaxID=2496273 RepID=UPI00101D4391|nr:phosphate ABC transporter permease PstA [Xylanivirga thermophila]